MPIFKMVMMGRQEGWGAEGVGREKGCKEIRGVEKEEVGRQKGWGCARVSRWGGSVLGLTGYHPYHR